MNAEQKNLVVIPARGGSKGIPRKNLRPLAGYPMIYYSIRAAKNAKQVHRVVVTTDDEEIALLSGRFGADVILRPADLADDKTTLDPVILHAFCEGQSRFQESYGRVITVQPTSPLVRSIDIDGAIELLDSDKDTVITVVDDRHLCWTIRDGHPVPAYAERKNRQQLPPNFRETGAVVVCSAAQINTGTRIGARVALYEIPSQYSYDIDTFADLFLCESLIKRKKIVLTVVGYPEVGLGHAYRAMLIAHELVQFDLVFVCEETSTLAIEYIKSCNYPIVIAETGKLADVVLAQNPAMVINDILDTGASYMDKLKSQDVRIVNFEDMGEGAGKADLVINALYPHQKSSGNLLVGPEYFCLRDEFLYVNETTSSNAVEGISRVLVTFGGVDEGNLTKTAVVEIADICAKYGIGIDIVLGPGYKDDESLKSFLRDIEVPEINVVQRTKRISDFMQRADLAITSAGRTVFELTALRVPAIIIAQNEREMTHTFASEENGMIHLGSRKDLKAGMLHDALERLVIDIDSYRVLKNAMKAHDLKDGKARVIAKIISLLSGGKNG